MYKLILLLALWLLTNSVLADSMRCGRSLVKEGKSNNALIKKCGQPARKYSSKESINERGRSAIVGVSNWVFERKGKKDMIVSLRSGTIVRIVVD